MVQSCILVHHLILKVELLLCHLVSLGLANLLCFFLVTPGIRDLISHILVLQAGEELHVVDLDVSEHCH